MNVRDFFARHKAGITCAALALGPALASAQSAQTPEQAIQGAQATVIGTLATAGGVMVAVALAGVGWRVGVKLIKRLSGAV